MKPKPSLDSFRAQPTWEQYFELLKWIKRDPNVYRRRSSFNELNRLARPLWREKPDSPLLPAIHLERGHKQFAVLWKSREFREFCAHATKRAWELSAAPAYELVKTLIQERHIELSNALREAFDDIRRGKPPSGLSLQDSAALLLWIQTKYRWQDQILEIIPRLRKALTEGTTEKATMLWSELVQLLPTQRPAVVELLRPLIQSLQQSIEDFTIMLQEQSAQIAQRDAFISLLQQQQDYSEEILQQAREQAEAHVKKSLMQKLAEPLDLLRAEANSGDDLTLILQSFEQALADLHIFPIGEIGRHFQVGPDDLVLPEDGEAVVGYEVEQTGLGWELRLSKGEIWPLVRPRVRRIHSEEGASPYEEEPKQ